MKKGINKLSWFNYKIVVLVAALFSFIPTGNFSLFYHDFPSLFRVEWVYNPTSQTTAGCYKISSEKILQVKEIPNLKTTIDFTCCIICFSEKQHIIVANQKITYSNIHKIRILPVNYYSTDDDPELSAYC
jgi:hypothetical protein